jgi:nicotinate-nucleotide pyrophosphorylase (carboxylating)
LTRTITDIDPALQQAITANVRAALAEDVGSGDISAELINPASSGRARIITRQPGDLLRGRSGSGDLRAGRAARAGGGVRLCSDGDDLAPDQLLFTLSGPARAMLTAERTILNFVQLLSGTATAHPPLRGSDCRHRHEACWIPARPFPACAWRRSTRCAAGGGHNHRIGLYDAYLIKENHIAAAASIGAAVQRARALHPDRRLEVEVETLAQLEEVIAAGADVALLDNFDLPTTRRAVTLARGHIALEASGGIDETTIRAIAETGVDYISLGAITKQVRPLDLSMRFV